MVFQQCWWWMDTIIVDMDALVMCVDNQLVAIGALILNPSTKYYNDDVTIEIWKWSYHLFILFCILFTSWPFKTIMSKYYRKNQNNTKTKCLLGHLWSSCERVWDVRCFNKVFFCQKKWKICFIIWGYSSIHVIFLAVIFNKVFSMCVL